MTREIKFSVNESVRKWRKTKRGLVTNLYGKMKERQIVTLTLEDLHRFSNCKKFDRLYSEWVKSGYKKNLKPSIDRISNKKGYSHGNIQWITWGENRYKQRMERRSRKGRVAQMVGDTVIKIYKSQREAVLQTGLSQGNMSEAISGKRKTCGGFVWKYI